MAFDVRMPDGTMVRNVPDGTSKDEVLLRYKEQSQPAQKPPEDSNYSWSEVPGAFVSNMASQGYNFLDKYGPAILNPGRALAQNPEVVTGAAQAGKQFLEDYATGAKPLQPRNLLAEAAVGVAKSYSDNYGLTDLVTEGPEAGGQQLRRHIAENPWSVTADAVGFGAPAVKAGLRGAGVMRSKAAKTAAKQAAADVKASEAARKLRVYNAGQAMHVQPPRGSYGTATEQALSRQLADLPVIGPMSGLKKQAELANRQLGMAANNTALNIGTKDAEVAGRRAKEAIGKYLKGDQSKPLYDRVAEYIPPGAKHKAENTQKLVKNIRAERKAAGLSGFGGASDQKAFAKKPWRSYEGLKRARSEAGQKLRAAENPMSPKPHLVGELKRTKGALGKDTHQAAAFLGGDDAQKALARADKYHRALAQRKKSIAPLAKANEADAKVVHKINTMAERHANKANIRDLRKIKKAILAENPSAWDDIGAAVLDDMSTRGRGASGEFSAAVLREQLNRKSPEALKVLFPDPEHRKALAYLKDLADAQGGWESYINTSKTALTAIPGMSLAYAFHHPAHAAVMIGGAAKGALVWGKPATAKHAMKWAQTVEKANKLPSKLAAQALRKKANKRLARAIAVYLNVDASEYEEALNSAGEQW